MEERLPPIHPGEVLLEDFMKPLGLSQYRLARDIGVTPIRISQIVNGKRSITVDTAMRLARYFGTSANVWLRMQVRYDLEVAEEELSERIEHGVNLFFQRSCCGPGLSLSSSDKAKGSMKTITAILIVLIAFSMTSCTSAIRITSTETVVSTIAPVQSVEALIEMIYVSDPTLPQYDPNATAYSQFPEIVKQLGEMGIDTASVLAYAIRFPRQDSYLAAQALLSMSPEVIATTVPILMDNLHYQSSARVYSLTLLGAVGKPASCAIAEIAPLLWDSDSTVRSSAAMALDHISEQDLVAKKYEIEITPFFTLEMISPDTPEGKVVEKARNWWNEKGSKVNWHSTYGTCDP